MMVVIWNLPEIWFQMKMRSRWWRNLWMLSRKKRRVWEISSMRWNANTGWSGLYFYNLLLSSVCFSSWLQLVKNQRMITRIKLKPLWRSKIRLSSKLLIIKRKSIIKNSSKKRRKVIVIHKIRSKSLQFLKLQLKFPLEIRFQIIWNLRHLKPLKEKTLLYGMSLQAKNNKYWNNMKQCLSPKRELFHKNICRSSKEKMLSSNSMPKTLRKILRTLTGHPFPSLSKIHKIFRDSVVNSWRGRYRELSIW